MGPSVRHDHRMTAEHWEAAYRDASQHSWDQAAATVDLVLLEQVGLALEDSVVDVGGGDGAFVQTLLERGHRDLTVVDVADEALDAGRRRVGERQHEVDWVRSDIRTWEPHRTWRVWHDRAAFHFMTEEEDREGYRRALAGATSRGSLICVGTFAPDGPSHCSGLPVARYDPDHLAEALGGNQLDLDLMDSGHEDHETPGGAVQRFTWVMLSRR